MWGNKTSLCKTTTTLDAGWHSDYAKEYNGRLVQIEVQFGKVELMFKDFCGFKIVNYERRLALGVEIVSVTPANILLTGRMLSPGWLTLRLLGKR